MKLFRNYAFTLAEGATHGVTLDNKQSFGFTLAEVLITLGIIGIVAAITIPMIVDNYQHRVNVNKWRKAYSQFSQVGLQMAEDYGASTFKEIAYDGVSEQNKKADMQIELFSKYFKVLKADCNGYCNGRWGWKCAGIITDNYDDNSHKYKFLNGANAGYWVLGYSNTVCFQTPDFSFSFNSEGPYNDYSVIAVDVNGVKRPNVIGKDIFALDMGNLRKVEAVGLTGGYYSNPDYECDKNAPKGGPACSAKYLISY